MKFNLETYKKFKVNNYEYFVIGADIGGTNSRIGFAGIKKDEVDLLFSFKYDSKSTNSFSKILNDAKTNAEKSFGINVKRACIAAAGPITNKRNICIMTNTKLNINRKKLAKETKIKIIPLINDLEAVGYSLNHLKKNEFINFNNQKKEDNEVKIIIAAGTGLGATTICNNVVLPSEAGHIPFAPDSDEEFKIAEFIKSRKKIKGEVQYEHLVSGPGLVNIYEYYAKINHSKHKKEIENAPLKSFAITKYASHDKACEKAFETFSRIYGRFTQNLALINLPKGGIYLFGSITKNNANKIKKEFMKEFVSSNTHQKLLKSLPIFVMTNDDAGIIGACVAATRGVSE